MAPRLEYRDQLDEAFFDKFFTFQSRYGDEKRILLTMVSKGFSFHEKNHWRAWIYIDDEGKVLSRIFANYPKQEFVKKDDGAFVFGHFEARDSASAEKVLTAAWEWGKERKRQTLKGPIQGNVFNNSRIKIGKSKKNYLGEPIYPQKYHSYFKKSGFSIGEHWVSLKISRLAILKQCLFGFLHFHKGLRNIRVQEIDFNNPHMKEEYFRVMYDLTTDSYASLADYTPFSYEEFKLWKEKKHIMSVLSPKFCLIAYDENDRALAFLLSIYDPKHPKDLLVTYLGKRKECEAAIKGMTLPLMLTLIKNANYFLKGAPIFCYLEDSSPSFKLMPNIIYRKVAEYVLYHKQVSDHP